MYGPLSRELFQAARSGIYRYSEEPFLLASGRKSHHYFNCKKITLVPANLRLLARAIRDEIIPAENLPDPRATGGLTMGADPIAYALSLAYLERGLTVYPLIVRKEAKGHGLGRRIEGEAEGVREVLVLDDVITTAGSLLKAVQAFRNSGLVVRYAVSIVDRQEGGREALEREGIRLFSLFRKSDFFEGGMVPD